MLGRRGMAYYASRLISYQFPVKETSSLVTGNWLLVTEKPITTKKEI